MLHFFVKTSWLSPLLQFRWNSTHKIFSSARWVLSGSIMQLYFFQTVENDIPLTFRNPAIFWVKIVYNIHTKELIGITFWQEFDVWLSGFWWKISLKILENSHFSWKIFLFFVSRYQDSILLYWDIFWKIFPENLNEIYVSPIPIFEGNTLIAYMQNSLTQERKSYLSYILCFLFQPDRNSYQATFLSSNKQVTFFNYRYLEKDISIVFDERTMKLKYFFTKVNEKEIVLTWEQLLGLWDVSYVESKSSFGYLQINANIPIDESHTLCIQWRMKSLLYPNI